MHVPGTPGQVTPVVVFFHVPPVAAAETSEIESEYESPSGSRPAASAARSAGGTPIASEMRPPVPGACEPVTLWVAEAESEAPSPAENSPQASQMPPPEGRPPVLLPSVESAFTAPSRTSAPGVSIQTVPPGRQAACLSE